MSQKETKGKGKKSLLEKKGLTRREYARQLAALKKAGVVSKRIDARSHTPTRYMLNKIRKYKDVSSGHAFTVPVKKVPENIRAQYKERGVIEERDKFFIVPKTQANQRAQIVKGHIALYHPLSNGEHRVIFLPFKPEQMSELISLLRDSESELNQMKEKNEYFGFQLYGNNSLVGLPTAGELATYLQDRYAHILNNAKWNKNAMQDLNFVLMRFKNTVGRPTIEPYIGERISHIPKGKRKGKEGAVEARIRRGYEAGRKRRWRARKKAMEEKNNPPPEF